MITKELLYEHLEGAIGENGQIDKAVMILKDEPLSIGITENVIKYTTTITIEITEIRREPT